MQTKILNRKKQLQKKLIKKIISPHKDRKNEKKATSQFHQQPTKNI